MRAKIWRYGLSLLVACSVSCAQPSDEIDHTLGEDAVAQDAATPGQHLQSLTHDGDPISSVGHGGFFDAKGQLFEPDLNFIVSTQRLYLEGLHKRAERKVAGQFQQKRARIKEAVQDEVLLNSFLITWFINQQGPSADAFLAAKSSALRDLYLLKHKPRGRERGELGVSPAVLELLTKEGAVPLAFTQAGGRKYIEECKNAGVPIPPDWGAPGWTGPSRLTNKFIVTSLEADVYSYVSESPRGVCMALPRFSEDSKSIALLGVICLGTDVSKACFWDAKNVPRSGVTPFSSLRGGADLAGGDVCSDCHAGENPFVVHPGSPLDLGAVQRPNAWYDPLVLASWPQNPGPTNVLDAIALDPGEGSCQSCHQFGSAGRFPEVSSELSGYCGSVLRNAVGRGSNPAVRTMPLGGSPSTYTDHIDALLAACQDPPSQGVDVPSDDIKQDPGFLSPPIVVAPLYGCATKLTVRGVLRHAKVTVFVDGIPVSSGEVFNPDEHMVDVPALSPGQIVTARQEYEGALSDPSVDVIVRDHRVDFPAGLPEPTIDPTLIYECGNMIAVRHLPGATVTVFTNGGLPRSYVSGGEWTNLPPGKVPFDLGDKFTAQYEICGDASPVSDPAEQAVSAPASVPTPTFAPPLTYAGQELVTMGTLLHGALSLVSVASFGDVAKFSTAISWQNNIDVATNLGRPLSAGDTLQGMQILCDKGPPVETQPTVECKELPPPRIRHPRVGDTIAIVTSAVPGARIRITTDAGEELADGSGTLLALRRPITSVDVLLVVQQIGECTSSQAYRINVRNADKGNDNSDK